MGKKVKKKPRSGQKEKRGPASPKVVLKQHTSNAGISEDGVAVIKDRGLCSHVESGINLENLSAKLKSSESLRCEDCRESVVDRRANKVKGKHGKKGGTNSKSESKAIWICLACGHLSCGGVGLPTTPQSHAVRHAKQNHHPLAVHYENHQLLWCFPCSRLISAEKSEDTSEHKEILHEVIKIVKGRASEGSSIDVEDVWFGSGGATNTVKSNYSTGVGADAKGGYLVRGMVNLGNTCFFNSTMQNLLAISRLRDHFFKLDEPVGPLTAALRKLFLETSPETGLRSVINPRSLFGSVCTKAPQFRGYQQHDSHELLRCLLDGLSTEELSAKKNMKSSQSDGKSSITHPTFVDAIFGGQISSTVSCLECRHSSTIYEPYLDLSLPIPTKKSPARRTQPVTRAKKPKLPPKRNSKIRSKNSRDSCPVPAETVSYQSNCGNSFDSAQSRPSPVEPDVLPSGDSVISDSIDSNGIALDMGLTTQDLSSIQYSEEQQAMNIVEQSGVSDSFTWLDYLEPTPASDDTGLASETDETLANQGSADEDVCNIPSLPVSVDPSIGSDSIDATSLDNPKQLNSIEIGTSAMQKLAISQSRDEQNATSQFENKQYTTSHMDEKLPPEGCFTNGVVQRDADLGYATASSPLVRACSEDSGPVEHSSGKDDEHLSLVNDSEVILLPYVEGGLSNTEASTGENEISSSMVIAEQDSTDFDGFGDLFNEPETTSGPRFSEHHASGGTDSAKSGVVGHSSESDPDEVDNADAPVSVESCLGFFTKPELLSKDEHAWQCENCSKILREKTIRSKTNLQNARSDILLDGLEDKSQPGLLDRGRISYKVNISNGNMNEDIVEVPDGNSLRLGRETNDNGNHILQNQFEPEVNVATCESETNVNKMINASNETNSLAAESESEVSEEENANSKDLKVTRDATKSILISKAPSVLTVHLKRFSQDARGRLNKLNGHVKFQETIDLKPYMDPRRTETEVCTYRLVGVVEHSGTMRGGHYVAYVRGTKGDENSTWYHASDAYVREASLEEVLHCEAYILFYEGT